MDILDGRDFCAECGGCGILFAQESWVGKELQCCDKCKRFKNDIEAAKAAGELIKTVYANHRRALDLGAGLASMLISKCADCPCHYVHVDDRGEYNDQRCTLLDAVLHHAWDEDVAPDCPLKKFSMTLRSAR